MKNQAKNLCTCVDLVIATCINYVRYVFTLNFIKDLTEEATQSRRDTLKYGLESPLQNYYLFNCSRKNTVRMISICIYRYIHLYSM